MKKSLIALAALATVATVAQAQSSVTIYGVIDVGVASVTGVAKGASAAKGAETATVTGMQNGGSGTSRLGFRGTEDLGGGLKANFNLEAELLADTGSTKSSAEALFNRASWVGLSGNFGAVQLGRMNAFSYAEGAKFDPFGGNNIGGYIAVGQYGYVRLENAVQYVSPSVNGLTFGVQTGTRTASASYPGTTVANYGEVAGQTSGNRNTGAMLAYNNGPLELSLTYAQQKDGLGQKLDDVTTAFARYQLGAARLVAGYMVKDIDRKAGAAAATCDATCQGSTLVTATGTNDKKISVYFAGVNYSLTPALTLNGMFEQLEYKKADGANPTQKPQVYSVGLNYALSKRTSLYGVVAQSKQDNDSAQAIVSTSKFSYTNSAGSDKGGMVPVADKDQTAYMIGVRHNF